MRQSLLDQEADIRKKLAKNYQEALKEVKSRILKMAEDSEFKGEKAMQAKYLLMLEAQLETILHKLGDTNVQDMTEYLKLVYQEAHLGCLYGLHQEGVGLVLQIDEERVERSVSRENAGMKFSKRLYRNAEELKETVKTEMARGFSTGKDYRSMAAQIALRTGISMKRAFTIARTEGLRVESESIQSCMEDAKDKGAEVVKEWCSTLDDVTRSTHRELDGQVREVEEEFEIPSTGNKAMYPGGFGIAKEDINCRCCVNQRARWALGSERYKYSRFSGDIVSIKSGEYKEWKEKYLHIVKEKAAENITEDDKRAIYDYMSFSSYPLNEALRNGWELTKEQQKLVENLDAALDKMPIYHGNLQRSVDIIDPEDLEQFVREMQVGVKKCFGQYVSCTCGEVYNPDANIQIYIKNAGRGKDITKFNQQEKEILYKRDMVFLIKNVTIVEGKYYYVLEEAADENRKA